MLVAVTDHAVLRYRQRIGGRSGEIDPRPEIAGRVRRAVEAGRVSDEPPPGAGAARDSVYVADVDDRALIYVCRRERSSEELVVVTLWERPGGPGAPRVPRRFTNALRDEPRS